MNLDFIKKISTVGAIAPTWESVSREITNKITADNQCIVEIWPWTGVFTKKILEKKDPTSNLICLEIEKSFVDILQKKYPQAFTHLADAREIGKYIQKHWYTSCNTVISGLPWASFEIELQKEILKEIHSALSPEWKFSTFAYTGIHLGKKWRAFSKL